MERRLWRSVRTSEERKEKTMKDDTRTLAWYRRGGVAVGAVTLLIRAHAVAATSPTIGVKEIKYGPSLLTLPVGTTGAGGNYDEKPHTSTSGAGGLSSP